MEITMVVIKIQSKHHLRGDKIIKVASGNPFHNPRPMIFGQEAIRCIVERQLLYQMNCCFSCGKPRDNGQGVTVFQGVSLTKLKPDWRHVVYSSTGPLYKECWKPIVWKKKWNAKLSLQTPRPKYCIPSQKYWYEAKPIGCKPKETVHLKAYE